MSDRYVVTVTVEMNLVFHASSHLEAVKQAPANAHVEHVRKESHSVEDTLRVFDYCTFCKTPIMTDTDGVFLGGAVSVPANKVPESALVPMWTHMACGKCAKENGLVGK